MEFAVDTTAVVTLFDESVPAQLNLPIQRLLRAFPLAGRSPLKIIGHVKVFLSLGLNYNRQFLVVKSLSTKCLLGRDILDKDPIFSDLMIEFRLRVKTLSNSIRPCPLKPNNNIDNFVPSQAQPFSKAEGPSVVTE